MRRLALMLAMIVGWAMFGAVPARGQVDGPQLSDTEQQATMQTFQYALENNKTDQAAAWVNPDTDTSGSLVPVRTYQNEQGQYCREYVTTITIAGQEEQGYGTACRQADGTWVIVSGESPAEGGPPAEEQTVVQSVEPAYPVSPAYLYPYGYPYWYLDYPYYVWGPYYPGIFFSFDIVYFGGHHHYNYHHHTYTRWYHAHRWHHVEHAARFHQGRHSDYTHSRGRFSHHSAGEGSRSGSRHFQRQRSRTYGTGSFHRTRQPAGVGHFNRARDLGTVRHYEGTRRFGGRHSTGTIHRSTTVHSFRGRMNVREHRGLGAFPSFRGRMGGTHHGSNGYHGGGYSGGKFRSGGHR